MTAELGALNTALHALEQHYPVAGRTGTSVCCECDTTAWPCPTAEHATTVVYGAQLTGMALTHAPVSEQGSGQ